MITEEELKELKEMHKQRVREWRKEKKKIDAWMDKIMREAVEEYINHKKNKQKPKPKKEITKEEFEKFINEKILPNLCF